MHLLRVAVLARAFFLTKEALPSVTKSCKAPLTCTYTVLSTTINSCDVSASQTHTLTRITTLIVATFLVQ